jgi:eukaryotic-like serine/threonine-protein kinase
MPDDRAQDVTPAEPGTVIGHYEVLGELGRGGMGVLYRARDLKLDREVALKRPYPSLVPDLTQRQRFEREARAAAQLAHPHIVPIFEVLEQDGVPWLAMELVNGRSLRSLLDLGEPLSLPEVLRHAEAMAGALAAAHARGILHRDVNPKNIMITTDGRTLLTDFGLARVTRERNPDSDSTETQENDVTRAGAVLGTPGYMSPEQALGRPVDPRSDLFCLGAVLYEMCTRERAFSASGSGNVLDAVLHHDPPPITRVRTDAPPELERIVRKLLSKDAEERYQDAADVMADVRALRRQVEWERFGSGRSHSAATPPRPRRRRLLATAVAIVGVLAAWVVLRPTPAGPIAFNERDWLLLADLGNDTGDPVFDKTLREGLQAVLSQSAYVNVFPDARVVEALERMKKPRDATLSPALARELCQREGIRGLVTGSIRRRGSVDRMTLQLVNPVTGAVVLSESEEFGAPEELFQSVDALTRRLRERLGESLPRIEGTSVPLEQATTASLEALQLYSAARRASRGGDPKAAVGLLEQAVGRDPDFALAHARLADARAVDGDRDAAIAAYAKANELRADVSARERYSISAGFHSSRQEYEQAAESLRALVGLYPDDLAAHHELALAYEAIGQRPKAIAELRECLRLGSEDFRVHGNLMLLLATEGRDDEALQAFEQARTKGVESPYFGWGVGLARLGRGEVAQARSAFEGMLAGNAPYDSYGRYYLTRLHIYEGRLGEADRQLAQDCVLYRDRHNQSFDVISRNLRARVLWERGQRDEARRELAQVLTASNETLKAADLRNTGVLLAQMREVGEARRVLSRLQGVASGSSTVVRRSCLRTIEGEIALAEGRLDEAERAFTAADAAYPHPSSLLGLARVQEQRRRWPAAAQAWERVLRNRGDILRQGVPSDWVVAHLQLGRALSQGGEVERARASYQRFDELWRNAEPSPLREQARVELQRLAGSAPRP